MAYFVIDSLSLFNENRPKMQRTKGIQPSLEACVSHSEYGIELVIVQGPNNHLFSAWRIECNLEEMMHQTFKWRFSHCIVITHCSTGFNQFYTNSVVTHGSSGFNRFYKNSMLRSEPGICPSVSRAKLSKNWWRSSLKVYRGGSLIKHIFRHTNIPTNIPMYE